MNNFLKLYLLIFLLFLSCNNSDEVVNSANTFQEDTSITRTNSIGVILGGDTTDWCYTGQSGYNLYAAYPNPCIDTLNIQYQIRYNENVKLYFKVNNDSLFIVNELRAAGYYTIRISKNDLGFHNQYKRLYMSTENFSCYGDIKFE